MPALRPETVLRRRLELQISVRYAQQIVQLEARNKELERELAEERRKSAARRQLCACPDDADNCECEWHQMAREAVMHCPRSTVPENVIQGDAAPDRAFIAKAS